MASLELINKVKYSPWLYSIYYCVGSFAVKVLGLFVKNNSKLIVFSCFGGRKYDDSPKCIYERMLQDPRFDDYSLVWSFMHPNEHEIPRGKKVKTDTFSYYIILLKARCWITNSTMERGLSFKRKNIFYFNTWHGTPIKFMGSDISKNNKSFGAKGSGCPYDVFCAQGQYDAEIFERSFCVPDSSMKIIGLPRNDELVSDIGEERKNCIKAKLGIENKRKILLYAPTFREYSKDRNNNCIIAPPIQIELWREKFGDDYVLLFRAHYEVVKVMNIISDDFVKDVSSYPDLNELMIVSDILISDYSSIFFDFSLMCKPMLCFAYDYDEYQTKRGLYFDIRKELNCVDMDTEEKLIEEILSMNVDYRKSIACNFRDKFIKSYGSATRQSLDLIFNGISK